MPDDVFSFTRFSVKFLFLGFSIFFRLVQNSILMMRGRIDRIQLQIFRTGSIEDIVARTGGNDEG